MLALWLYKVCMLQASRSYLSWAAHKNLRSACYKNRIAVSELWAPETSFQTALKRSIAGNKWKEILSFKSGLIHSRDVWCRDSDFHIFRWEGERETLWRDEVIARIYTALASSTSEVLCQVWPYIMKIGWRLEFVHFVELYISISSVNTLFVPMRISWHWTVEANMHICSSNGSWL